MEKVNVRDKLALFSEQWSPKVVGRVNDAHVKLVKLAGEFVWHAHADEDEMFYVVQGSMVVRFRDQEVRLEPGEFLIVPRGVEHMPVAHEECCVMLVEPAGTVNTGDAGGERTREAEWI